MTSIVRWRMHIAAAVVLLAFSRRWFPLLASDHGAGVDRMLRYSMIIAGTLIVAGHALLGYMLLAFLFALSVHMLVVPRFGEQTSLIAAAVAFGAAVVVEQLTVIVAGGRIHPLK